MAGDNRLERFHLQRLRVQSPADFTVVWEYVMKYSIVAALLFVFGNAMAAESAQEWDGSVLKDETIQQIQKAQFTYKKCVTDQMQKPDMLSMESRHATDAIIKACEPTLGEMRKIYVDAGVPETIADRPLRKLRIQVTRNLLQELMYREAAKQAGAPNP
jgi:hypothetical protein